MSQRGRFIFQSEVSGMAEPGHFQGVATSTHLTRDGKWQFSEQAVAGMAQQGPVPLSSDIPHPEATISRGHVIGMVAKWQVTADGKTLLYEGQIDPKLPADLYAWYCSWFDTTNPFHVPIKVSVGGFVPKGAVRTVRLAGQAGTTEFVDAIKLDHVLLCRADSALNPEATIEPGGSAVRAATGDWQDCIFMAAAEAVVDTPEGQARMMAPVGEGTPNMADIHLSTDSLRQEIRSRLEERHGIVEPTPGQPVATRNRGDIWIKGVYLSPDQAGKGKVHYEHSVYNPTGPNADHEYIADWQMAADGSGPVLSGDSVAVAQRTLLVNEDDGSSVMMGMSEVIASDEFLTAQEQIAFFADMAGQASAVSTAPWTLTDAERAKMPDACFLYVAGNVRKFPVYEMAADGKRGKLNVHGLHAAVTRLHNTDAHVQAVVRPKLTKLYKELGKALPPSLGGQAAAGGIDMAAEMTEETVKRNLWTKFAEFLGLGDVPPDAVSAAPAPASLTATVTVPLTEERVGEIVAQALDTKLSALEARLTALVGQTTPPPAAPAEVPAADPATGAVETPSVEGAAAPPAEGDPPVVEAAALTAEDVGQLGQALQNIGTRLTEIQEGQVALDERLKTQEMRGQARPVTNQLPRAAEAVAEPEVERPKVFRDIVDQIRAQVA